MTSPQTSSSSRTAPGAPQLAFRSGAVARMVRMPVSTLRIWEQRYQAVRPSQAPSGHRLYSSSDVERVVLLRRLTTQGHAIGSLAGLDTSHLQTLALGRSADELASSHTPAPAPATPLRVVVVGRALAQRLRRPATLAAARGRVLQVVEVFEDLAAAVEGAPGAGQVPVVDLLLWQAAALHADGQADLQAAQQAWRAMGAVVFYRFAGAAARQDAAEAGAVVAREPESDGALGAWLASLPSASGADAPLPAQALRPADSAVADPSSSAWVFDMLARDAGAMPARRFDDAALTDFAGLSSTIACECPGHVAELLMQIASFEAYSAGCGRRDAADEQLHAYLQRVSGAARLLFEAALERIARAEGLPLPPAPPAGSVVSG